MASFLASQHCICISLFSYGFRFVVSPYTVKLSSLKSNHIKSLLIVRHAKSSWADLSQKDFDRPLNDRGKKDAPALAKKIHKEKKITLDAVLSSPAKRAIATAKFFAEEFNVKNKNIIELPYLYEASTKEFYEAVSSLNNDYTAVALFSHNPGITAFVNALTNTRIDDMPTCAVFAVHVNTNNWKEFETAEKEFWFFDYPKNQE